MSDELTTSFVVRLFFALFMMYIMGRQDRGDHTYWRLIIMAIIYVVLVILRVTVLK